MSGKRQTKNLKDFDLASGFFSHTPTTEADTPKPISLEEHPQLEGTEIPASSKILNKGGRPKKEGLKNRQYTLTLPPELYEKVRIVEKQKGYPSFSQLVSAALKYYCREKEEINLDEMVLPQEILQQLKERQLEKKD